jgi:Na+/melibiose symporter-like transporter
LKHQKTSKFYQRIFLQFKRFIIMKKFTNIKSSVKGLNVLTPSQMLNVKGGLDSLIDPITGVLCDDKRRDRPGGGISTL